MPRTTAIKFRAPALPAARATRRRTASRRTASQRTAGQRTAIRRTISPLPMHLAADPAADPAAAPAGVDWPSAFPADVAFRCAGADSALGVAPGMALLPTERALLGERAAARRVLEFSLGRACAHAALAALAPERAAELAATPIGRAAGRCPRWPTGFVGAITHHRGVAAAAVARADAYRGVGLDLEALRPPSPALVQRILRPEERARWEALPAALSPAERTAAFIRVFSAKESLYKALFPHTGVYLGFQDAEIELEAGGGDPGAGAADLKLRWRLHKACGPQLPVGFTGPGRVLRRGNYVLSAVWLER